MVPLEEMLSDVDALAGELARVRALLTAGGGEGVDELIEARARLLHVAERATLRARLLDLRRTALEGRSQAS